jgi:hypothetical protein
VEENISNSAGESDDSECDKVLLPLGADPPPSCTIYNTVFFEGIPALSDYGMVILVLLMFGMGLAGVRRLN